MNEQNQTELFEVAKEAYGIQNEKILDKYFDFMHSKMKLDENLVYHSTKSVDISVRKGYKITSEIIFDSSINPSNHYQFAKNIAIKNLNRNHTWDITVELGHSKIFTMRHYMYDAILYYFKLTEKQLEPKYKDCVFIPLDTAPWMQFHSVKISLVYTCSETEYVQLDTNIVPMELMYDIYLYDSKINKLNIYSEGDMKLHSMYGNQISQDFLQSVNYEFLVDEIQYHSEPVIFDKYHTHKIRTYGNHPIDCICLIIPKELENITLSINKIGYNEMLPWPSGSNIPKFKQIITNEKEWNINMSPTIRINSQSGLNTAIYKFPYINFSRTHDVYIKFNVSEDSKYYNKEMDIKMFMFNVQLARCAGGMLGTVYSK